MFSGKKKPKNQKKNRVRMCRGMVFKECFFFYYFQTAFFIDVIDASTMPHATVCSLLQIRTVSPCLSHEFSVVIIMLFIGMS